MKCSHLIYLVLVVAFSSLNALEICRDALGLLNPQNNKCYYLVENEKSYLLALSQCVAISSGNLVSIQSEDEDMFIRNNISTFPIWIGLSDRENEDEFKWEETELVHNQQTDYSNWVENWADGNTDQLDCVYYNADIKWEIRTCEFSYPYLCKFASCESNDGTYCIGEAPTTAPAPFNFIPIAVVVVILIIVIILIICVVLILFYLYKKQNDVWKRMCSCFTFAQTKQKVHGLEQENFRLRKELGNMKHQSINLSGSQSLNRPQMISSIPDGQGGMLPSIRPKLASSLSSGIVPPQTLPASLSTDPSKPGPPPLAQNTSILQNSMNYSFQSHLAPTPMLQPNLNTSITSDQIAGILWPQKPDFQAPRKPALNSTQQRVPSRSLFQSPFPVASTPFSFPNSGNPIASPIQDQSRLASGQTGSVQKSDTQGEAKPTETREEKADSSEKLIQDDEH